jgi:hypothetical protein
VAIVQVPSVYPPGFVPTIVDTFVVDDGHVVNGVTSGQFGTVRIAFSQIVQVPGLAPFGFVASITGGVISGDGHVVFGASFGQFGRITISTGPTSYLVGGVPSAQQFGTPLLQRITPVGGVGSAQQFGAIGFHTWVGVSVPGVQSEAALGTTDLVVYNVWLHDSVCLDEELAQLVESQLVLALASTTDLDLDPVGCP